MVAGKQGINILTAVVISVVVTAALVGAGAYFLLPGAEVPEEIEITMSDVETFLADAESSELTEVAEIIPQDILASELKRPRDVTIGFIWSFPHDGSAWCAGSEISMEWMKEQYPYITAYRTEDVGPDKVKGIAESMIEEQGCDMLFINDEWIGDPLFDISEKYPDVWFHSHGNHLLASENHLRYHGRVYQVAYLHGLIAGAMTKTNNIGIVWAVHTWFLTQLTNAFALGVQEVNPDAKIYGAFVWSWYDPPTELEVTESLLDTYDCDVVFSFTDSPVPHQVCTERGVWSFAPYGDMVQMGWMPEDSMIVSHYIFQRHVGWDKIFKAYMAGVKNPQLRSYYGYSEPLVVGDEVISGVDMSWNGKIGMEGINPRAKELLPKEILELVEMRRNQMIEGTFEPFRNYKMIDGETGEVYSEAGEMPTDEQLMTDLWFIEGVIPPEEQ